MKNEIAAILEDARRIKALGEELQRELSPGFIMLPIDDVPVFAPAWNEIRGKAHLYETARLRSTGEYVKLCRVVKFIDGGELAEPVFACRIPSMAGVEHRSTEELCDFGL